MNKVFKYFNYTKSYLKYSDFRSILDSVNFVLFNKGAARDRIIDSYLGKVKVRKGTNDFQFMNYYYEWSVKSFLLNNCHRYDYFIDIGAGIGDYSLLMAQKGLKVIAFEPVESSFEIFEENIRLNGLGDEIKAYNYAVGEKNEEAEFIVTPVNTGASHRADIKIADAAKKGAYRQKTIVKNLDSIYHEFGIDKQDRILLKMDMEGMEAEAVIGGKDFFGHFDKITVAAEAKHTGEDEIIKSLNKVAKFEYGEIDKFNIWARKTGNI
jgi:FkbM family methyltransferase